MRNVPPGMNSMSGRHGRSCSSNGALLSTVATSSDCISIMSDHRSSPEQKALTKPLRAPRLAAEMQGGGHLRPRGELARAVSKMADHGARPAAFMHEM